MRREPSEDERFAEKVALFAADPLNLAGILVPGDRVAANSGALVTFRDGVLLEEREPVTEISAVR